MAFEKLFNIINFNEYTSAIFLFFGLFILLRIGLYLLEKVSLKMTSKTKTDLDDKLIKKVSMPLNIISLLIALYFSLKPISFTGDVELILNRIILTFASMTIGYLFFVIINLSLIRVWKKLAEKTKSNIDDSIANLVHETLRIVLIISLFILILNIWGVNIGPFLAGLGIGGIAVALALQPTLGNIFSGVSIILDNTFKVGDVIKIENDLGEVYKIGLRTTRIKTFDNEMLIIPNSVIANNKVQNFLQPDLSIRVNIEFGVAYGVDPEYIKKIVIEEIEKSDIIDKEEEVRVLFTEMGDSSLNFKAMFWVDNLSKKWPAHQEAISRIYRRLYKENIEIPFPQQTVWLREEKNVKSSSPSDIKFKEVKDKYYAAFGHEYKEEKVEEKQKETKSIFKKFRFGRKK